MLIPLVAATLLLVTLAVGNSPEVDVTTFDARSAFEQKCSLPAKATGIPDAATATEAEFLAAQVAVREFDAAVTAYTRCLADEHTRLMREQPASGQALDVARAELNNAAVDQSETLVGEFNEALGKFRNRDLVPARFDGMLSGVESQECNADVQSMAIGGMQARLRISATGEVEDIQFSQRLNDDTQHALRCVIANAKFLPATRKGVPEASEVTLPMNLPWMGQGLNAFRKQNAEVALIPIVLESGDADIARGLKACRPKKLREGGRVELSMTINTDGRVLRSYVWESSGSRAVDEVARCVAKWLKYKPGIVGRRLVEVPSIKWGIDIPALD